MSLDLDTREASSKPAARAGSLASALVPERRGARLLAVGIGVGEGAVTAVARYVGRLEDLANLRPGEIAMLEETTEALAYGLARAGGLLVNEGGANGHAAGLARRLGIPAVVGARDGASPLWSGAVVTLLAGPDDAGRAYQELSRADRTPPRAVAAFL